MRQLTTNHTLFETEDRRWLAGSAAPGSPAWLVRELDIESWVISTSIVSRENADTAEAAVTYIIQR